MICIRLHLLYANFSQLLSLLLLISYLEFKISRYLYSKRSLLKMYVETYETYHCNSLSYGILDYQTSKLQRVMNASARLIYRAYKFCHITPLLVELHWLPVRSRIHYKIILITFKVLHGLSPKYLSDLISVQQPLSYKLRRNDNGHLLERPGFPGSFSFPME